jgi:hypothetical protein
MVMTALILIVFVLVWPGLIVLVTSCFCGVSLCRLIDMFSSGFSGCSAFK